MEDHETALGLPSEKTGHISIRQGAGHYLLPFSKQLDGSQSVPQLGCLFKAQFFCRPLHLCGQICLYFLEPPLQQGHGLGHRLVMLGLQLIPPAVAVTLAHMKVEAGPLLADIPGKLLPAGGQAQGGTQGVDNRLGAVAAGIGPKVPRSVLRRSGRQGKAGIRLIRQADIGIAFIVLQQNIVPGLVPLDERALQDQGLKLAVSHNDIKVVDLGYHGPSLFRMGGQIRKVLAHPVFQRLRLTYIDDSILCVLHDIHAGLQRQAMGFFFQFLKGHGALPPFGEISKKAPPSGAFSWEMPYSEKSEEIIL